MQRAMSRRQFAIFTAGAALAGPHAALAQTPQGKPRRIGVMLAIGEDDQEGRRRLDAFLRGFEDAGWVDGRNAIVEVVWYRGNYQIAEAGSRDLIARGAEVIVVNGTPGMDALRAVGAVLPIVFVVVSNPVGAGYVPNLSRPGGNITGFSTFEPEIAGKWLQILRQVSPGMKTVNMLLDPKFKGFNSLWEAVEEIAPRHGITPRAAHASSLEEIQQALAVIAKQEAPALIVSPSPVNTVNRQRLISIANESRIPAIYPFRFYVHEGALLAYGFNAADQFKRAAGYASRILKGEKAGDLPVQAPSLFEFGINVRTAKAMGLQIPQSLLVSADEIVE